MERSVCLVRMVSLTKAPRGQPVPKGFAQPGLVPGAEYIQKILARCGLASRREAETWLRAGRIQLNGRSAVPGDRAGPGDHLRLDGRPVRLERGARAAPRVVLYHKPVGRICTREDPQGRPTIYEQLPDLPGSWFSVGRLDINTSGLLLFSNDGDLVQRLAHPSSGLEREYMARIYGRATPAQLQRLLDGVRLDGRRARFHRLRAAGGKRGAGNQWYRVVLLEGRKREVRRLWETQGLRVNRLVRIRFGPLSLPAGLRPGDCWELPPPEVRKLLPEARRRAGEAARPLPQRGSLQRSPGSGGARRVPRTPRADARSRS